MRRWFPILLLLFACGEEVVEHEPEPVIFGLLEPRPWWRQTITVDRTYGLAETVSTTGVSGARVKVMWPDTEIYFQEGCYVGFYYGHLNWFSPRTDYELEVILPWGDTVYGRTRVPAPFRILEPSSGDTVYKDSLPDLIWTRSEGAYLYMVYIAPLGFAPGPLPPGVPPWAGVPFLATQETSLKLSDHPEPYFYWVDTTYTICVEALDENVYNYGWYDSTNLSQGYGVFGGHALDLLHLFVKRR
jgi:hypothetical protein